MLLVVNSFLALVIKNRLMYRLLMIQFMRMWVLKDANIWRMLTRALASRISVCVHFVRSEGWNDIGKMGYRCLAASRWQVSCDPEYQEK